MHNWQPITDEAEEIIHECTKCHKRWNIVHPTPPRDCVGPRQCMVKDCVNLEIEGRCIPLGVGEVICGPCYTMLKEGKLNYSDGFLGQLYNKLLDLRRLMR